MPGLLTNNRVKLSAHAGKPVVVNFFASRCVYCNEELPGFVQVANAPRGKVDFVGVDTNDTGDVAAIARRFDLAGAGFSLAREQAARTVAKWVKETRTKPRIVNGRETGTKDGKSIRDKVAPTARGFCVWGAGSSGV